MEMKPEFYHQGLEGFGGREEGKSDLGRRHFCGFFFVCFIFCLFSCRPFLKSLLNLLQYCCCFFFFFFLWFAFLTVRHLGILAPRPGSELVFPAMEGEALTTGLPGKSQVEDAFEKSTDVGWE